MAAFCVVEHFEVIKHITASIFPRDVDFSLDPFPFQKLEKALSHGVVMTIASAAHAGDQIVCLQKAAPIGAAVLGGFNRSSQHWIVVQTLDTHSVLRQVFSIRVFFEV